MKLGPKISEGRMRKRFGKNISKLIPGGDEQNCNFLFSNSITNEVIIDFSMLSASMKDRIDRQVGSTQIITPKDSNRIRGKIKI
jgi:hypothetical protein